MNCNFLAVLTALITCFIVNIVSSIYIIPSLDTSILNQVLLLLSLVVNICTGYLYGKSGL